MIPVLALQEVSGCQALLHFKFIYQAGPWLSRKWVAVMPFCVSILLNDACFWLFRL